MITQLNVPFPLVTPKGKGLAYYLIDYGPEHDLFWIVFLDSNGECWTFKNPDIRAQRNITQGREYISPFYDPDDYCLPPIETCEKCSNELKACVCMHITKGSILEDKELFPDGFPYEDYGIERPQTT